jgi:hypothetical protein
MKYTGILLFAFLFLSLTGTAQNPDIPVLINLKNGQSIDALHFGQIKCGTDSYSNDYILIRGKYMDSVTEIKEYNDIEKIILEDYKSGPVASVGNEKGTLKIIKKNGVSVTLTDAEITMSCYGTGDLYNTIIVKMMNPLTNQAVEQTIETRNIQSIIFK